MKFVPRQCVASALHTVFVHFVIFSIALLFSVNAPKAVAASMLSGSSVHLDVEPGIVNIDLQANSTNNIFNVVSSWQPVVSVVIMMESSHGNVNVSGTTITYTPTPGYKGRDSIGYWATLANGGSASGFINLTVVPNSMEISTESLSVGAIGVEYYQAITAAGGVGPYRYQISSGRLPGGVNLGADGTLTGIPTEAGTIQFTVTATDSTGQTASQPLSIRVTETPTIIVYPESFADASNNANYARSLAAVGGFEPYRFEVTAGNLPPGMEIRSGTLLGSPRGAGTYNFTITATDSSTRPGGPFSGSRSYSLVVKPFPPSLVEYSPTVLANSSDNVLHLINTGGWATSAAIVTQPLHGTAVATSATTLSYTPNPGYSGPDSFTYTASNIDGASAPATMNVTVSPQSLSLTPAGGTLPEAALNTNYFANIHASGGLPGYTYSLGGALPPGLTLSSWGAIEGVPTSSGTYNFSITAVDVTNLTVTANYSLTVTAPGAISFSPAGGALSEAMAGEAYSQQVTASGGTGTKIYSVASGSLPKGLVLNISTGQLNGPLAADSEGDYSFAIQVRDGNGAMASASYTLKVKARTVSVADKIVGVPVGSTPANVYLNSGATGGPFTAADLTFVEPANAGTATIIQGELAAAGPVSAPVGWYLQYTPNPAYSGQVRVGYKLTSALGTSNTGTITYNLRYDAGQVADDISNLVHDFVRSRQNMIANTIEVPGLLQRRQMEKATDAITARMTPSQEGMTLGFSTSLSQMRAAGGDAGAASAPFNVWISGAFLAHSDKSRGDSTSKWGSFAMVNMGADYLISDRALIGVSFHYDRMTDPTDEDAELTGNGWLAGPYASLELGKGVFWNGSLRYGGSSNTINTQFWDGDFKTTRWMADTSIEGQWNLDEDTTLSPKLRMIYFSEKVEDYAIKNGAGDAITIEGFNEDQFRVSLGAEIARSFSLESGAKLTPKLGVTGGFSGLDGSGAFGAVTAGMNLQTASFWMLDTSLLFNIEGDGQKSIGAKVAAAKKF